MSGHAIREATPGDIARLVEIEAAAFQSDRISRRSFRRQIASKTLGLLVATRAHKVQAYALVAFRRTARHARLYSLAIDPETGRGLGTPLMARCEAAAQERGYPAMRLEVRDDNTRAIGIYERSGYRQIGWRPEYYEDGATALLYEKLLAS